MEKFLALNMNRLIGLLFVIIALGCKKEIETSQPTPIKLLAILAHPDDESAMGQVLSRYAREGNKVYLVIAADGRNGVEEHAGIPAGDSLAAIRKTETLCACKILGIEKPIFLGAYDSFGISTSFEEYFRQTTELKEKVAEQIERIQPNVILTFGPDGDTGHLDHKGIGDLVTEVILRSEGWQEKYPLYYLAWPKEKKFWMPQGEMTHLNYVHESYRNTAITYTKEDQDAFFKSLSCYKSQYTPEDIEKWIEAEKLDTTFTTYFREFVIADKRKQSF
ncbi:MAG: PIG-L family deacetylase [Bacteroidota bacterium]|nr:PIG-L family deacetylase [Bacteroidota bacterium]MEC7771563.1 PIG-L family deacetylase [Bacteroidota bacterium]